MEVKEKVGRVRASEHVKVLIFPNMLGMLARRGFNSFNI